MKPMLRRNHAKALAVILTILAQSAKAEVCPACTPVVRMNEHRAACLDKRLEDFAEQARASTLGFLVLDVDNCTFDGDEKRGVVPFPRIDEPEKDRTMIMDAPGLECITRIAREMGSELRPEAYIDVLKAC